MGHLPACHPALGLENPAVTKHRRYRVLAALSLAVFAFWLYGEFRTMQENVGFNFGASLRSLCLLAFVSLPFWFPFLLRRGSGFRAPRTSRLVIYSLILGSVLSEAWILLDEARFKRETVASLGLYSRWRAWPNGAAALVYVPYRGIHATD
jgi:hypothetical protein